ncbi:hypothetical protein [Yoonia sp. 2307UL14-13]|uniref:hypothetical protein n=1 Tax=Yoonia sp. 2307UL14-13 TaxID=3126506 RepID=UPI003097F58F
MVFFRAIPFSLNVFIRFLPIAPFLAIVMFCYMIVAWVVSLILGLISPPLALLVIFGVALAAAVVPAMVGIRLALQSRGVTPAVTYGELLLPSIMYGVIEAVLNCVLVAVVLCIFVLLAPIGFGDVFRLLQTGNLDILENVTGVDPVLVGGAYFAISAGYLVIRCLLLVPLGAAAIGRDPDGSFYTPLKNFGAGFWPLMLLSILSAILMYFSVFIAVFVVSLFADAMSFAELMVAMDAANDGFWFSGIPAIVWGVIAVTYAVTLLGFALQCAGAALVWLQLADGPGPDGSVAVPRIAEDDLRDLRKSRMPMRRQ